MTRILVRCQNISIGDVLFASGVAKKLKERHGGECIVDFRSNYLQPIELLGNNPWIDSVFYKESPLTYDIVHELIPQETTLDLYEKKPSQFQRMCGIEDVDDEYEIYTNSAIDYSIKRSFEELTDLEWGTDIHKIAYQSDWDKRSMLFTESECARGDFSGSHRNVFDIINPLEVSEKVMLFSVGLDERISKNYPCINSTDRFTFTASLMKYCDYAVGTVGCLTNLAAAVGTKTIITTDYIHAMQQSGKDSRRLQLGPKCYFPNDTHIELSPYMRDDQVGDEILRVTLDGN